MVLIEDDALVNPSIPEPQLQYILHLQDTHQLYTRFFDGLLIPRPSHSSFFRDLRSFRVQATVIALFSLCNPSPETPKEATRAKYREITHAFLASRFAHPWCRKAMAGTASSKGWWGAEWAATGRKMSREAKEQEEKLHKLLVPVWIVMRARMFPGADGVDKWYEERLAKLAEEQRIREKGLEGGVKDWLGKVDAEVDVSELGQKKESQCLLGGLKPVAAQNRVNISKSCTNLRQDFWDSDEAAELEELKLRDQQAAHVATSVFRVAAAGLLLASMPKREKWKLRKLMKEK